MKRSTLALALVALLALGLTTACGSRSSVKRTISVSADATIKAKPNMVNFSFGVSRNGISAPRALAANSVTMQRVIAAIKKLGVAPRDIQTQQVNVYPRTDSRGITIGFTATNSISVNLHDVSKTGRLITKATGAGANIENGPTFSQENTDLTYEQALNKALDKAHAKAAAMAKHTGLSLGKPATIKEGTESVSPPYPLAALRQYDQKVATAPIQPGRIEVTASVTVVYSAS
jgi:uncharacterized protein YggE